MSNVSSIGEERIAFIEGACGNTLDLSGGVQLPINACLNVSISMVDHSDGDS
jgi:hypothetical protein